MLNDTDWGTLVDKIEAGECTPFLGAGAAAGALPVASELATHLLNAHQKGRPEVCPLPDQHNLAAVAQYVAVKHKESAWVKARIRDKINSFSRPDFSQPGEPHGLFARLPLRLYLTTNYDDFLYSAVLAQRPNAHREFSRWTADHLEQHHSVFDDKYKYTGNNPVVFHLHGIADDEYYRSIVVTEDDYVDFLVAMSRDLALTSAREMVPTAIRRAVTQSSLLFVGYSLKDINFRVLLRGLLGRLNPASRDLSLTVQFEDDSVGEMNNYLKEYFHFSFQLSLVHASAGDFCTELQERCRQRGILK
jgi:hypothetical protein